MNRYKIKLKNGREVGPFSVEQIKALFDKGANKRKTEFKLQLCANQKN